MISPLPLKRANPADNPGLCDVFANTPMEGAIWINQDRRPDFFHGAAVQSESPEVFVLRKEEETGLNAVFAVGRRNVFVNGRSREIQYLSDLRIVSGHRGGSNLARGFQFLRHEVLKNDEFAQTLVLSENEKALDLLTSRRCGLPGYFPCGEYEYYLIGLRHLPSSRFQVRRATPRDVSLMQEFFDREAPRKQFFPVYRFDELDGSAYYRDVKLENFFLAWAGDELVGLLGAWDQGNYKKILIRGYAGGLKWLRPWLNAFSRLRGGIELPAPGALQRALYLHCAVCRENDPDILTSLIREAQSGFAGQGYHHAALGLDRRDPLREALAGFRTMNFAGRHFLVTFGDDPRSTLDHQMFYFEAARI
ncbi:hypothetical protein OAK38_04795 [Verrucomicrobia bacterium]|nr:hypothetical protein [Verrucomicrobiota bacterium]